MSIWWIQVVGLVVMWLSVVVAEEYPTCGTCWCVPDNNGTASCPSDWQPTTTFSPVVISSYLQQKPSSIYHLNCNPYQDETCTTTPAQSHLNEDDAVCAYKYPNLSNGSQACSGYQMITYVTQEAALADQAVLTHKGSCGLCSTTQDLAVYLTQDFTAAGKKCATIGLFNEEAGLQCYMQIGLTKECAKIWNYDGIYDGQVCGKVCATELKDPNNGPPPACTLNDCLQCDEDNAGPNFTSFAGRTRRRSGLLSEIVRPCNSIAHIDHDPCVNVNCQCTTAVLAQK